MLAEVSGPNDAKYRHDALGRRILRYTVLDGKLVYERYFYDGADVVADYDGRTGEVRALYLTPFLDENLLKEDYTGLLAWYTQDGLGSVRQLVVGDTVQNSYTYTAWGVPLQWHEEVSNRYTFTGREYSDVSESYFFRARYYIPILGSFQQPDKLWWPRRTYRYVLNCPTLIIDPTGLVEETQQNARLPVSPILKTGDVFGPLRIETIRVDLEGQVKFKAIVGPAKWPHSYAWSNLYPVAPGRQAFGNERAIKDLEDAVKKARQRGIKIEVHHFVSFSTIWKALTLPQKEKFDFVLLSAHSVEKKDGKVVSPYLYAYEAFIYEMAKEAREKAIEELKQIKQRQPEMKVPKITELPQMIFPPQEVGELLKKGRGALRAKITAGKIYLSTCRAEWIKEQVLRHFGIKNVVTIIDARRNAQKQILRDWLAGVQWFTDIISRLKKDEGCSVAILAGPHTYSLRVTER